MCKVLAKELGVADESFACVFAHTKSGSGAVEEAGGHSGGGGGSSVVMGIMVLASNNILEAQGLYQGVRRGYPCCHSPTALLLCACLLRWRRRRRVGFARKVLNAAIATPPSQLREAPGSLLADEIIVNQIGVLPRIKVAVVKPPGDGGGGGGEENVNQVKETQAVMLAQHKLAEMESQMQRTEEEKLQMQNEIQVLRETATGTP